jgi:hypothetical protein
MQLRMRPSEARVGWLLAAAAEAAFRADVVVFFLGGMISIPLSHLAVAHDRH